MNKIIVVIMNFTINLLLGIFSPIDSFIYNHLPSLAIPISYLNDFLTYLKDFILWILSWLPFNSNIWSFFISYIILRITISSGISIFKIVVKWWHYIAP